MKQRLILASGSPRRRDLLKYFYQLSIKPPRIDESVRARESASIYVRRMAHEKFAACIEQYDLGSRPALVLAADTIVVMNGKIYGKPKTKQNAAQMMRAFSGKRHEVLTAVAVGVSSRAKPLRVFVVRSHVQFRKLKTLELDEYLKGNDWKDKAGAYAIQGDALPFVAALQGSLSNVVGLPVSESLRALAQLHAHPSIKNVK